MLAPTVSLASGDPALLWWLFGGVATHVGVGLVLIVSATRRMLWAGWLLPFAVITALVWYLYMGMSSLGPLTNVVFMILAPLTWLLLLRRR